MGAPESFTATSEVGHFIGGRVVGSSAGAAGRRQAVYNPAFGRVARQVTLGTVDDVNAAVAAAQAAFPAWADTPFSPCSTSTRTRSPR
jgi:malonate-semialdehyde dehydrogenase (acetylating)/methylmalonate-semialdehyde dehydrogenase